MMKKLAILTFLTLLTACSATDATRPDPRLGLDATTVGPPQPTVINDRFTTPGAGWAFHAQLVFTGPIAAGEMSMTPSGVMHVKGAANAFDIVGDLVGTNTFVGDYQIDTRSGRGRSINSEGTFVLTAPAAGTFECGGSSYLIEDYLPPDYPFVQEGNFVGCNGTGAFEGMHMKGQFTNGGAPGIPIYDVWGVIW